MILSGKDLFMYKLNKIGTFALMAFIVAVSVFFMMSMCIIC